MKTFRSQPEVTAFLYVIVTANAVNNLENISIPRHFRIKDGEVYMSVAHKWLVLTSGPLRWSSKTVFVCLVFSGVPLVSLQLHFSISLLWFSTAPYSFLPPSWDKIRDTLEVSPSLCGPPKYPHYTLCISLLQHVKMHHDDLLSDISSARLLSPCGKEQHVTWSSCHSQCLAIPW